MELALLVNPSQDYASRKKNANSTLRRRDVEALWDDKIPKEKWDTFMMLFSKKNNTRLQLLENELLSISQHDMTVAK